jgi:glycine dehydrogenase subunit 1
VTDVTAIAVAAHAVGALVIVATTEAVSFGLLKSPGEMGADIAVAEGQSIGNGLSFGGPYVGLFACAEKLMRQAPGRLCGETVDADGRRGFVLTLSTREQHIRRDKATSNICTNSGLCALAFSIHMTLLGGAGLETLARINHARARRTRDALAAVPGVEILTARFFNEFAIRLPRDAGPVVEALARRDVLAGVPYGRLDPGAGLDNVLMVCATETTTDDDIDALAGALTAELAA